MADVKISQLPPASPPLTGGEILPLVQNGVTVQASLDIVSPGIVQNPNGFTGFNGQQGAVSVLGTANGSDWIGFAPNGTAATPRSAQTKLREVISVKDFGAQGDGIADDTAAIQAAINYCMVNYTTQDNTSTGNGGQTTLFFPQGIYKVTSTLRCNNVNGFYIKGAGMRSTTIVLVGSGVTLFELVLYVDFKVSDMQITTGTISFPSTRPQVNSPAVRNNTAFSFNGTGGGTLAKFQDVAFWSFDVAMRTTDNIVNCDNHTYLTCVFINNNYVWKNTNPQAVAWAFFHCKIYSTQIVVFENAGGDFMVYGGDYINKGTFYKAELLNMGYDAHFIGVRFENYQNIDPTASPKFLDIVSGTHQNIIFDKCTARGGGSLTGKTSATLSGLFYVVLRDCNNFGGNWEVNAGSSVSGTMSTLIFNNCANSIVVNQTLFPGAGNRPINLLYTANRSGNGVLNRSFAGAIGSTQINPLAGGIQSDYMRFEAVLNATSSAKSFPVFCPNPYQLMFAGADITFVNTTANTVVINVWADSTKTSLLATATTSSASGVKQYLHITPSANYTVSSTSNPLYVEFVAAANAGACQANINLNFLQAS